MDATETDDPSLVGEACHIVAHSPDGPRGASDLAEEHREKYRNLILLCNNHHKQIDDQVDAYPVNRLLEMKRDHENWVRQQLDLNMDKQRTDELYAGYIEHWSQQMQIADWRSWTRPLMSNGQPAIHDKYLNALDEICSWILSRVWPAADPDLECALMNFRLVAEDLRRTFALHATRVSDNWWETAKFYKVPDWDPEKYARLGKEFDDHVDLVQDLTLELTRAANYVCDAVRGRLFRSFRIHEGVLLVEGGPYADLTYKTYRVEYQKHDRPQIPYPGLDKFEAVRFERDIYFGQDKKATTADA